jgi:hypothetical protein
LPFSPPELISEEQALQEALQVVEYSDALVRQTVLGLSRRSCAAHLICEAAREELEDLRPHLLEAFDALARIERRRGLTDQELTWRRAFRSLLDARRMLREATAREGR